jgi:hypothetical protein
MNVLVTGGAGFTPWNSPSGIIFHGAGAPFHRAGWQQVEIQILEQELA